MLSAIGVSSTAELLSEIPEDVRFRGALDLPPALTEFEIVDALRRMAEKNLDVEHRPSFLGAGAYRHFIPSVVDAVISRPEFATAYTPYQPEASQGTLQVIFEFQSMICALTGLDVANASLYDGSTAMAEAALLCASATGRHRVLVSRGLHPEYRQVLRTYCNPEVETALRIDEVPLRDGATDLDALSSMLGSDVAAVLVGDPNFLGIIEASDDLARRVHEAGAMLVSVHTDITSLGLLPPPSRWGVDVAVGEAAAAGLPPSFGGPFVGFMAVREALVKRMPGRLAGLTKDHDGRRGFCLTLQTREQHIRREKATSNICTNQSLCALAVTVWLTALGPQGLREVAERSARRARYMAARLAETGLLRRRFERPFYHELAMQAMVEPRLVNEAWAKDGISGGHLLGPDYDELGDCLLLCATEVLAREDIDRAASVLAGLASRQELLHR